jgi:carbonic anhydrase
MASSVRFELPFPTDSHVVPDPVAERDQSRALLIACSDGCISRRLPSLIGSPRLRIVQSPGNQVRPYQEGDDSAGIAEALCDGGLRTIVVCGHSQCAALRDSVAFSAGPVAPGVMGRVYHNLRTATALLTRAKENVLAQVANLETYPAVAEAVERGRLRLHAWLYLAESGVVLRYDRAQAAFVPLHL